MAEKSGKKSESPANTTKRRLGALIRELSVSPVDAAGFLASKGLKPTDRMTPEKFERALRLWRNTPAGANP